jgi:hypothetical protein
MGQTGISNVPLLGLLRQEGSPLHLHPMRTYRTRMAHRRSGEAAGFSTLTRLD